MKTRSENRTQFVCQECGYPSPKWLGRCPECGAWNKMTEEIKKAPSPASRQRKGLANNVPQPLQQVSSSGVTRLRIGMAELDRVLGEGIVPGSLVLVGGDPGIGKSTLLLQMAFLLSEKNRILYVSGEESASQVKMRADRLGKSPANLYLLCETDLEAILTAAKQISPAVMIMDSIQTLAHPEVGSVPGSVSQVRECGGALMNFAKSGGPAIFLVGHVTKEGSLAGPRILEHMVDTVLYFEGDRQHGFRIIRTAKNRFGSTNEVGIFEMGSEGLREVGNPSRYFLDERKADSPGSAVAVSLEGTRPLLIEIQALVAPAYFGMPQRRVSGLDYNRSCLLLAVLERRAGFSLASQDVFLSIAGGLTVDEPAVDLAVVAAVVSALKDIPLDAETVMFGEVGLGGEVRAVTQPERRVWEAAQLGFKRCVLPQKNAAQLKQPPAITLVGVDYIRNGLATLLRKNE